MIFESHFSYDKLSNFTRKTLTTRTLWIGKY